MPRYARTVPIGRLMPRCVRTRRVARLATTGLLIAGLLLSGCSLFAPKLQAPHLSVINVTLLKSDLWHQELKVRMRVQNPNDRRLPVQGLTYVLDVDGQELARGQSDASFVVPPLGEADFDMSVSANMAGLLVRMLGQGATPMEYHLAGRIALSQGLLRNFPFDERGSFRLN